MYFTHVYGAIDMWTKDDLNSLMRRTLLSFDDVLEGFGNVYEDDDRPTNSKKNDIVVNVIDLNAETPQIGTSNVLIYMHDKAVKIGGEMQYKKNAELKRISSEVFHRLRTAEMPNGVSCIPLPPQDLPDVKTNQHFAMIRIQWVIAPQINK